MLKNTFYLLFFLLFVSIVHGQNGEVPDDYFRPPLDGRLYLSGTFGELRSNHFHAGIDIKTGGAEGKKVYAIADGYVSRIKVSTGGYGKAVYITHPNGYVSVYGHLQKFNTKLEKFVNNHQYKKESFVMEAYPGKDELVVQKGDIIAFSGNTGGSSAPHLHFEIREESSQHPVNPLMFKSISVKDFYRPKILEVGIYPVDDNSLINGKNDTVYYSVGGWGEQHYLTNSPKIKVSGNIAFGIRTYDAMNDISNKNGVYTVDGYIDSLKYFGLKMDKISFATSRYLNSLIDYNYFKLKKRRLIRSQVDTNNRLFNYTDVQSNGIVQFSDSSLHNMKYIVDDIYGNTSKLEFAVKSEGADRKDKKTAPINSGTFFEFQKVNKVQREGVSVSFPANAFYQSLYFLFDTTHSDSTFYSDIFHIHNKYTAVQKAFTLEIEPKYVDEELKNQLYISYVADNGGTWYIGSKWNGNRLQVKSKLLGNYSVKADTIPPIISPVNIKDGASIRNSKSINVKIRDKQTGIKRYRGTLNDNWILMEYEPKKNVLVYKFDDKLQKGTNEFKLVVSDLLGNETIYEATLSY